MKHKKLIEKFEEYWYESAGTKRKNISFTTSEIDKLLRHFSGAIDDPQYRLALETALRFFPFHTDYRLKYASFLLDTGKTEEAKAILEELRKQHEDNPGVAFLYARYLNTEGKSGEALRILKKHPQSNTKDLWFKEMSIACYQTGEWMCAWKNYVQYIKEQIKANRHLHPVKKRMSILPDLENLVKYARKGNIDINLVNMAEELLLLDGTHPDLWIFAGDRYKAYGTVQKALQAYQKAQLLDETYLLVYYKKAEILEKSQSPRHKIEAIKEYLKSLRLSPSAYVNFKIGELFHRLQYPQLAEVYYENALYEDPAYVPAWLALIRTLYEQGKQEAAEKKIRQATEMVKSHRMQQVIGRIKDKMEAYALNSSPAATRWMQNILQKITSPETNGNINSKNERNKN